MVFKILLSSFSFKYSKGFQSLCNTHRYGLKNGIQIWTSLRYPVVPFKLTDIGEGIKEVTIKQCHINLNQRVSQFEDICDVESDKATVTITSRFDGFVKNIYFKEGDIISVGSTLMDIEIDEDNNGPTSQITDSATIIEVEDKRTPQETKKIIEYTRDENQDTNNKVHTEKALTTPAVRRIAKEHSVDINSVRGTGKHGRVTKEDVLIHLNQPRIQQDTQEAEALGVFSNEPGASHSQPITAYRKVMFKTMTESNRIPTLTISDEIDITDLEILRKTLKITMEKDKVKLTLLSFVIKAISLSLRQFPILNATLEGETIKYASSHNIGVAVDTQAGLVVPNIKNVHERSIRDIALQVENLQRIAQEGKLSLADTAGGTFTVTNIGSIAGTVVKPLILPPQVAIVGIGRMRKLPRFDQNDVVRKCYLINASWAADHRIIDGATVAKFSNVVKSYLENPGLLAVDA